MVGIQPQKFQRRQSSDSMGVVDRTSHPAANTTKVIALDTGEAGRQCIVYVVYLNSV